MLAHNFDPAKLITVAEAAARAERDRSCIYDLVAVGALEYTRVDGRIFVHAGSLHNLLIARAKRRRPKPLYLIVDNT